MSQETRTPLRLLNVPGFETRSNDVIFCEALHGDGEEVVVYFGGDIQDFRECMEDHRDNKNYRKWSLDDTAVILQSAFPKSHVVVVRPSKMEYKTFSSFENFVPSGNCGVPHYVAMHHSLQHLEILLKNISSEVKKATDKNLTVIGFSKGCVVLNQFLHEFYAIKDKDSFISRIKRMFWLDGGHSGGKNTWITSQTILEVFAKFDIEVYIHVSPYQIQDERRPWIRKEEKIFYNVLCSLKAPVYRSVHFEDSPPSIYQHFNVLNEFHKHSCID